MNVPKTVKIADEYQKIECDDVLYKRTSDGQYVPVSTNSGQVQGIRISKPKLLTKQSNDAMDVDPPDSDFVWDGWPDGIFQKDFTFQEFDAAGRLQVNWAIATSGGDRKGHVHASIWQEGKRCTARCLGIIECRNPECQFTLRPVVKTQGIQAQLNKHCVCGSALFRKECDVTSRTWTWAGGVHYIHQGYHTHRRPPRILHLLPSEKTQFQDLVTSHPKTGPLGLVCGVPSLLGPGKSAAEISEALLNADRVSYERQKIIKGEKLRTMDGLIQQFADFDREHPNFVLQSTFGEVTVVSFQTPFMRSQMIKDDPLNGPINGLVNDAAHGWWKERNHLLMISSTYCPVTQCWVPGVLTFTNGASGAHFQLHFYAVMLSMSREAEQRGIDLTDELFVGVCISTFIPFLILIH